MTVDEVFEVVHSVFKEKNIPFLLFMFPGANPEAMELRYGGIGMRNDRTGEYIDISPENLEMFLPLLRHYLEAALSNLDRKPDEVTKLPKLQ
jgi:hypothetical protein